MSFILIRQQPGHHAADCSEKFRGARDSRSTPGEAYGRALAIWRITIWAKRSAPFMTSAPLRFCGLLAHRPWPVAEHRAALSAALWNGPNWTRAPSLVIVYTLVAFVVTIVFSECRSARRRLRDRCIGVDDVCGGWR